MSTSDSKDPAAERRAKLQALRERRAQAGAEGAVAPGAGAGGSRGGARPGGRPGGGGGAGGGDKNRRAQLFKMMKNNPEKAKEIIERFPQLKEIMEQRKKTGTGALPGGLGAGGRGRGLMGGADPVLNEQMHALEKRLAELGESLEKTRAELADKMRAGAAAPAAAPAAPASTPTPASAPAERHGSVARAKLATLKKSSPKK